MKEIRRPALRYFGGKWRLAPWVISFFPEHACYVEPFAGAASVLLRKRPSRHEYYNDANREVWNFFRVLRERGDELIRSIELTPYSREELRISLESAGDQVERARRLYVRYCQGRGAHEATTGWRYQRSAANNKKFADDFKSVDHLPAIIERLQTIGLENDDAFAVIRRFDSSETLFYLDPPYLVSTRGKSSVRYGVEFKTEHDHRMLAAVLGEIEGMAVLSGVPCDLYAELFEGEGWERHDREHKTQSRYTTESVWLNPACQNAQRQQRLELVSS